MALPLDQAGFCVDLGAWFWANGATGDINAKEYSQSCIADAPDHGAVFAFGGGHACSPYAQVWRLPYDSLTWSADYPALPLAVMQQANKDASGNPVLNPDGGPQLTYMRYPSKVWDRKAAGAPAPAIAPVSRHSWTNFIYSRATKTLFLLTPNSSSPYTVPQGPGGSCAEYDPVTREWTDLGLYLGTKGYYYAACEDRVSGNILLLCSLGLMVFDPRQRKIIAQTSSTTSYPPLAQVQNLVHAPWNDRFYYFTSRYPAGTTDVQATFEFALDRDKWLPVWSGGKCIPMVTNWRPRPGQDGQGWGYSADPVNKVILGGQTAYKTAPAVTDPADMYALRPDGNNAGTWLHQSMPGAEENLAYCQTYVESLSCLILGSAPYSPGRTMAFRWDPAQAQPSEDLRGTKCTITAGGVAKTNLQAAADAGGAIVLGAGALFGGDGAATFNKPAQISAAGASIVGAMVQSGAGSGQGALVTFADTTIDGLTVKDVGGQASGVAGIRQQQGNLAVSNFRIEDCPDGMLCGGSYGAQENATLTLTDGVIANCGTLDGQAHHLYVHKIGTFAATRVTCQSGARGKGNMFKSKSRVTTLTDCVAGTDATGTESYNYDFERGGLVTLKNCTAIQDAKTDNPVMLNYGNTSDCHWYPGGDRLYVEGGSFTSNGVAGAIGLRNSFPDIVAYTDGVAFVGTFAAPFQGPWKHRNCTLNGAPIPATWDASPLSDPQPAPAPTISSVSITPVAQPDGSVKATLKAQAFNVTSAELDGVALPFVANGPGDVIDSLGVLNTTKTVTATHTFVLTVHGPSGDASVNLPVTVGAAPPPPPPPPPTISNAYASPATLPYGGGTVTVSADVANASSVTLDGAAVTLPVTQHITADHTFALVAHGTAPDATASVSVTVETADQAIARLTADRDAAKASLADATAKITAIHADVAILTADLTKLQQDS